MKPRAHIARSRVSVELFAIGTQGMQPFLGTIVIVSSHHQTIPKPFPNLIGLTIELSGTLKVPGWLGSNGVSNSLRPQPHLHSEIPILEGSPGRQAQLRAFQISGLGISTAPAMDQWWGGKGGQGQGWGGGNWKGAAWKGAQPKHQPRPKGGERHHRV